MGTNAISVRGLAKARAVDHNSPDLLLRTEPLSTVESGLLNTRLPWQTAVVAKTDGGKQFGQTKKRAATAPFRPDHRLHPTKRPSREQASMCAKLLASVLRALLAAGQRNPCGASPGRPIRKQGGSLLWQPDYFTMHPTIHHQSRKENRSFEMLIHGS